MALDPRTPVIVATGQLSHHAAGLDDALEPAELCARALQRAEEQAGGRGLLGALESIRYVALFSWKYPDPAAEVAKRIGANPRETIRTTDGGNTSQALLSQTCLEIRAGTVDLVAICGAEAARSAAKYKKAGHTPPWTVQPDGTEPTATFGDDLHMVHPAEAAKRIWAPTTMYPIFEHAIRHAEGRSIADHMVRVSELWSRFSAVAAKNPNAWIQREHTAAEIGTPTASNRMIGYPYPKLMNSNNDVDQGAGVVLASVEKARQLGIPEDHWVFPHNGCYASDRAVSVRWDLHDSPFVRTAGREVLAMSGITRDDLDYIDLYSCFPSAVQVGARELGLPLERQLTVTGGLTFAGGPWNNYVMHAIATMADLLRENPGTLGLVWGNGGFLTKHSFGVYSTTPPAKPFGKKKFTTDEVDRRTRDVAESWDGPCTIESWTVTHDRAGAPERAVAPVLLPDGRRAWGVSTDPDTCAAMASGEEFCERPAHLDADGTLRLA